MEHAINSQTLYTKGLVSRLSTPKQGVCGAKLSTLLKMLNIAADTTDLLWMLHSNILRSSLPTW